MVDVAVDQARRAANHPEPAVFAPPIAVFNGANGWGAKETDLFRGLAISVECDEHPDEARWKLEEVLGPATVIVRSGGQWIDDDGLPQDKLHLHWRLAQPTASAEEHAKLKLARKLAAKLVGGDPSNVPAVHCLRWPGSWHRKKAPRLCEIVEARPDVEIKLDAALAALNAAAPASDPKTNGGADAEPGGQWGELIGDILAGRNLHLSVTRLAAKYIAAGMSAGAAVNQLRALMERSAARAERPSDWQTRYADIPRLVSSAREKYAADTPAEQPTQASRPLRAEAKELRMMTFNPITFMLAGLIPSEGVTLICSKPKVGKSWLLLDLGIAATMDRFVLGEKKPVQGDFLYLALEDSLRRLQSRMTKLLGAFSGEWPEGLHFHTQWRRVDQGGLDDIRKWVAERRAAGRTVAAVAVDVLKMIRPAMKRGQPAYDADYEAITGLQQLAMELSIAIIVAHHTRKAEAEDLIDKVSGTFGIVGASDTIIVIERSAAGTVFDVRGRDVEGDELAVQFNKATCRWTILGAATEVFRSETRGKILAAICDAACPVTPRDIESVTALPGTTVRKALARMVKDGDIIRHEGGRYASPSISRHSGTVSQ
jgi:hypothetical protein